MQSGREAGQEDWFSPSGSDTSFTLSTSSNRRPTNASGHGHTLATDETGVGSVCDGNKSEGLRNRLIGCHLLDKQAGSWFAEKNSQASS